jgi:hypothetical protein
MNTDHSPPTLIHPLEEKNTQRRDVEPEIQEIEPDNTGAKPTTITAESIKSSTLPSIQRQSTIPSIMTVNLGELDQDEQAILEADIKARKKTRRRASKYDEDDRVIIGTRVSEGHRNYQLMYGFNLFIVI